MGQRRVIGFSHEWDWHECLLGCQRRFAHSLSVVGLWRVTGAQGTCASRGVGGQGSYKALCTVSVAM